MNFGEKIRALREENKMTQQELADAIDVSLRTISAYETQDVRPRYRKVYQRLADLFNVSMTYLLSDEEDFILSSREQYGSKGAHEAQELVDSVLGLFAGGEIDDEDKKAIFEAIQEAYFISKINNKKYTPKKFLDHETNEEER